MGIFIGDSKNSNAAKAALNISWAVDEVINPPSGEVEHFQIDGGPRSSHRHGQSHTHPR
ncbi:DNA gyrase inhibitor GyrI [Arthrobacter sp. 1088]|nr:DNA gyrase inhibitor GyrI [Arthrobacter sp. 1088]